MDFGFVAAFIMLLLPAFILWNFWRRPQGKLMDLDNASIMIGWVLGLMSISDHRDKFLVIISITQILFLIMFILFTLACIGMMKDRSRKYPIALVVLSSVLFLARLAFTFRDPVEFAGTSYTTGPTVISLTVLLCEPFFVNAAVLLGNGFAWSVLISPDDMFIVIPNLIGGLIGLVYALRLRSARGRYRRRYRLRRKTY